MTEANKLRVLHLHSGNMLGGVESVLLTFAEFASTCPELEQEFALAFEEPFAKELREHGATVHILPEVQLRNPLSVSRSRQVLRQLLRNQQFHCVISHSPWCQIVFAPAIRRANIPLIFWMHGSFDGHWLQRVAARHAPDLVICNSAYTRSTLPKIYPHVPSRIVYYPVRAPKGERVSRTELRKQLAASAETVVILMASRTEPWKGHLNLLRAAAQIRSSRDWMVWIAGGPQTPDEAVYFKSIQTETKRMALDQKVHFLGQRKDVPALMTAADIFCQPNSKPEPFGVVFIEALQAGVPVVTSSMGGAQEILDQSCGILVSPGDIPQLSAALVNLIEDAALRSKLGSSGPARAQSLCDPAQQIRRVFDVVSARCGRE